MPWKFNKFCHPESHILYTAHHEAPIEKGTYIYQLCYRACTESGFEPKVAFTGHKVGILVDLVTKGMGVALLMKQLALYAAAPNTAIVDISPYLATQIYLCYLKDTVLSPAAKHFVQCAEAMKK